MTDSAKEKREASVEHEICQEIQDIMLTYREQEAEGDVGTPGGLEHMGDVWSLLSRWDARLRKDRRNP